MNKIFICDAMMDTWIPSMSLIAMRSTFSFVNIQSTLFRVPLELGDILDSNPRKKYNAEATVTNLMFHYRPAEMAKNHNLLATHGYCLNRHQNH